MRSCADDRDAKALVAVSWVWGYGDARVYNFVGSAGSGRSLFILHKCVGHLSDHLSSSSSSYLYRC